MQTASLDQLMQITKDRYNAIQSLNASVQIVASTGGGKEGSVTEYTALGGYILIRKPSDLRVILFLPIAHLRAIDMVTNGTTFNMSIPPKNRFITGTNAAEPNSKNPLENLRPGVFFDSLMIKPLGDGQLASLTADEREYQPDPKKKYVIEEPTYELSFHQPVLGSVELKTLRTVHFGRSTMLPFQQDIYDSKGQLATQATYENYQRFGDVTFPQKITIRRPQDQLSLVLTVTKLIANQKMEDDQFQLKVPDNVKVEQLP